MLTLKALPQKFSVCKLPPHASIPQWIWHSSFYSINKTMDELSFVCEEDKIIAQPGLQEEKGWKCLQIMGILDFSLTGILSSVAAPLSSENISIFAISTYNTDYILIKKEQFEAAKTALTNSGFTIAP